MAPHIHDVFVNGKPQKLLPHEGLWDTRVTFHSRKAKMESVTDSYLQWILCVFSLASCVSMDGHLIGRSCFSIGHNGK